MAVVIVGILMIVYVTFGGMLATTWVQIIKAVLLLSGATLHGAGGAVALRLQPGSDVRQGGRGSSQALRDHGAGHAGVQSDRGDLPRHGADLRHRGTAAHPDALLHRVGRQGGAKVGVRGDRPDRLLLHPDLHHRLRRDHAGRHQSRVPERSDRRDEGSDRRDQGRVQHGGHPSRQRGRRQPVPGLHLGRRLRNDPRRGVRPGPGRRVGDQPRPLRHRHPQGTRR